MPPTTQTAHLSQVQSSINNGVARGTLSGSLGSQRASVETNAQDTSRAFALNKLTVRLRNRMLANEILSNQQKVQTARARVNTTTQSPISTEILRLVPDIANSEQFVSELVTLIRQYSRDDKQSLSEDIKQKFEENGINDPLIQHCIVMAIKNSFQDQGGGSGDHNRQILEQLDKLDNEITEKYSNRIQAGLNISATASTETGVPITKLTDLREYYQQAVTVDRRVGDLVKFMLENTPAILITGEETEKGARTSHLSIDEKTLTQGSNFLLHCLQQDFDSEIPSQDIIYLKRLIDSCRNVVFLSSSQPLWRSLLEETYGQASHLQHEKNGFSSMSVEPVKLLQGTLELVEKSTPPTPQEIIHLLEETKIPNSPEVRIPFSTQLMHLIKEWPDGIATSEARLLVSLAIQHILDNYIELEYQQSNENNTTDQNLSNANLAEGVAVGG